MRLRMRYKVNEEGRFLGHLDSTRMIMRTMKRANVPVMLSEGFNPHPRISFGMPLAVGHSSLNEYFDIVIEDGYEIEGLKERINEVAPGAIEILEIKRIKEVQNKKLASLNSVINSAKYLIKIKNPLGSEEFKNRLDEFMNKKEIVITKTSKSKVKDVDIKDLIYDLRIVQEVEDEIYLMVFIAHGSKENLRIQDLLAGMTQAGLPFEDYLIDRVGLFIKKGDQVKDPMDIL